MQTLVDREGSIALLLDLEDFGSEAPSAWRADVRFGHGYRHKIDRMAIVEDKRWRTLAGGAG